MTQILPLLAEVIHQPLKIKTFSLEDWDLLVRQARRANVFGTLAYRLEREGLDQFIPCVVKRHFDSQKQLDIFYRQSVGYELDFIDDALSGLNTPFIVLKGAAYVASDLPCSYGRMFSDIDILVPQSEIEVVEKRLKIFGWFTGQVSAYDDRYYRQWMHEIPSLHHIKRGTCMDLHHAILPPTCKLKPKSQFLFDDSVLVAGGGNMRTLSSVDMLLHSMTHLFHEGEFNSGFRDLVDLDSLVSHSFAEDSLYWEKLVPRAEKLDLLVSLYYGLRYLALILKTPIPSKVSESLNNKVSVNTKMMDFLFTRALLPDHASCDDRWTGLARWLLFIRSHYLRMPLYLLIPHLLRKAYMDFRPEKKEATT